MKLFVRRLLELICFGVTAAPGVYYGASFSIFSTSYSTTKFAKISPALLRNFRIRFLSLLSLALLLFPIDIPMDLDLDEDDKDGLSCPLPLLDFALGFAVELRKLLDDILLPFPR